MKLKTKLKLKTLRYSSLQNKLDKYWCDIIIEDLSEGNYSDRVEYLVKNLDDINLSKEFWDSKKVPESWKTFFGHLIASKYRFKYYKQMSKIMEYVDGK